MWVVTVLSEMKCSAAISWLARPLAMLRAMSSSRSESRFAAPRPARYPASLISVYAPWELILLALAGFVTAVAGALGPAGWAARTRTAFALRAE
jgi:hypothetical protein